MNPFKVLLAIIWKNMRLIFRSKTSALIILIGPILIIAIVGAAFNSSGLNNIKIGTYVPNPNAQTDAMMSLISSNDFSVIKYTDKEKCIDDVRQSNLHLCMALPEDFNPEQLLQQNKIEFYVDYSKINLVWMMWDIIQSKIRTKSADISKAFTKTMLEKVDETAKEIQDNRQMIVQISSDGKAMSVKLENIKNQFVSLDVSIPISDLNITNLDQKSADGKAQIEAFKKKIDDINNQIKSARDNVEAQQKKSKDTLDNFEVNLLEQKNITDNQLNSSMEKYNSVCTSPEDNELCKLFNQQIDYIKGEQDYVNKYLDGVRKSKADLQGQTLPSTDTIDLASMKDSLDAYSKQLDEMQGNIQKVSEGIDKAKQKSAEVSQMKDSTAKDIDQIAGVLNSNLQNMDQLIQLMDTITQNLNQTSNISPETIIKPITTGMRSVTSQQKFINYFLPSLLILVVMFIGILLSSTAIMAEKESKAFFRNFLAPVNDMIFVLGHFISMLIIIMLQSVVLLFIAHYAFSLSINNFGSLLLTFLIIDSLFILFGMFIGYFFRSEEGSTIASISSSCLFLLFSSIAVPIETMSEGIGKIAQLNPFVLSETVLKKILLFDKTIGDSMSQVLILLAYILVLFILVVLLHHWSKNKQ